MNSNLKKILIITASFDRTVDYFIGKYKNKAIFFRINTDKFADYDFLFGRNNNNDNLEICIKDKTEGKVIYLTEVYSIYYRKPYYPLYKNLDLKYKEFVYREFTSFLTGLIESFDGKVLTKPLTLKKAENKLIQLKIANQIGFKIPNSVITNSQNQAEKFIEPYKWITKPLSYGRMADKVVYTSMVKDKDFAGLEIIPAYFQEYINKKFELRLTVINKIFFPVKITSDNKTDWRKGSNNKYCLIEIPNALKRKCLDYMNKFNLNFCAFDFIYDGKDYYFLEGNPNGQWLWLEKILSLDISEKIFNYLIE